MITQNEQTPQQKSPVMKLLALIGLVSLLTLGVWLAVQVVRVVPPLFTSLASIAEGLHTREQADAPLRVAVERSITYTGESLALSWSGVGKDGIYAFSYDCTEGVALDGWIGGERTPLPCGEITPLGGDARMLEVRARSEKRRFADVPFTVFFTEANGTMPVFETRSTLTVVNPAIPQSRDIAFEAANGAAYNGSDEREAAPAPAVRAANAPAGSAPRTTTLSRVPVSHPDGFTDVRIIYRGVGGYENEVFTPAGQVTAGARSALRFEVRNIGSRTSERWRFTATLPNGTEFVSEAQEALKPNERATITLGFNAPAEAGTYAIEGAVATERDRDETNNRFSWSVSVEE